MVLCAPLIGNLAKVWNRISRLVKQPGRDTLIHHVFMFTPADFDAALAHVEFCGVEVLFYKDKGHRSVTGRHAYFHDPDGTAIEFIDFQGIGYIT